MLPIIFLVPLVQLIILVNAATLEMKEIKLVVLDQDHSVTSREMVSHFEGSPFFRLYTSTSDPHLSDELLLKDQADLVLLVPGGYEKALLRKLQSGVDAPETRVQLQINAINATAAGLTQAYASQILQSWFQSFAAEKGAKIEGAGRIEVNYAFWYNPQLNYKVFMVPAILLILITIMGMFLTALNLVREKELGTIEQINVTPIRKYEFITGKLIPFWIIGLFELAFGIMLGLLLFRVPFLGSPLVLFSFAAVYLVLALGIGLLFSTLASNQQQVMFMTFFFMLTFILMGGIFTPVESMPGWAQQVNVINPFAYFMRVIRMVMLKGSGFSDILPEFIAIGVYALLVNATAVWRYRKTV
jgi:ABC-2 type transport system permease protein